MRGTLIASGCCRVVVLVGGFLVLVMIGSAGLEPHT